MFLKAEMIQALRNKGNVLVAVDTAGRNLELIQLLVCASLISVIILLYRLYYRYVFYLSGYYKLKLHVHRDVLLS